MDWDKKVDIADVWNWLKKFIPLDMPKNKYRVVADNYAGYEVQIKKWWFPLCWFQCYGINTHTSMNKAMEFIEEHKRKS